MDSHTNVFCVDDLTPSDLKTLLLHLNIVVRSDMGVEKMKETLQLSSIYMEKFESYDLRDVVVFFNEDTQVVNLVTKDKKEALYELDCEYPCCICHFNVDDDGECGQGLQCSVCESWFHNKCTDTPLANEFYNSLTDSPEFIKICCPPCLKNGQVKRLYKQIAKFQGDFKKELSDVKLLLNSYLQSSETEFTTLCDKIESHKGDVSCIKTEISCVTNELECLKSAVNSDLSRFSNDIGEKIQMNADTVKKSHKGDVSCFKSEISCIASKLKGSKNTVNSDLLSFSDDVGEIFQQNVTSAIENLEEVTYKLKETSQIASNSVKNLSEKAGLNASAIESALDRVVDNAERLDKIVLRSLSDNVIKSAEKIQQRLNDNVLLPGTLASKLAGDLSDKLAPEIVASLPNCSHNPREHPLQSPSQENAWITKGAPNQGSYLIAVIAVPQNMQFTAKYREICLFP